MAQESDCILRLCSGGHSSGIELTPTGRMRSPCRRIRWQALLRHASRRSDLAEAGPWVVLSCRVARKVQALLHAMSVCSQS
jgi:hypothetical protein